MLNNSFVRSILVNSIGLIVAFVAFVGYDRFYRAHDKPYQPPLAAAAVQYRATLSSTYHQTAERVRGSVLADKQAVVKELQEHARPLATALDQAFAAVVDDKGHITNPEAAADFLEQTSKALR